MSAAGPPGATDLPWLQGPMTLARAALSGERAPHSLLVIGQPGAGLALFADWLIALRHCESRELPPCGRCKSCLWLAAGHHPDHLWLTPLEESKEIRIDQVRALLEQLAMTGHQGRHRTALIAPAERLNRNAANAFLKMLEEPPAGSLMVLASAAPSRLPATIRSRCLRIELPLPGRAASASWLGERCGGDVLAWHRVLEVAGNDPVSLCQTGLSLALAQVSDLEETARSLAAGTSEPLQLARKWDDERYERRLQELENLVTKYLLQSAVTSTPHLLSAAQMPKLRPMFELLDRIRDDRLLAETPVNRRYSLTVLLSAAQAALQNAAVLAGGGP